jgi:hypothetical protein
MRRALAAFAALACAAVPAQAANHVRVVLDLSISMRHNDSGRLAKLSTLLLFDLVRPNPTLGDSFDVIPFAPDWRWTDPNAPPPTGNGVRITARLDRREELIHRLAALAYDAKMTYFYPGLLAALQDLEGTRGAYDVRTIVLVTDGVPEQPTRDRELELIKSQLAPRLARRGIRLYVLAFGGEAAQNRNFFEQIVHAPDGKSLGEFFVDPLGRDLLTYMLQIFSGSFGYTADTARPLPGTSTLDLDASTTPAKVAVVVLCPRAQPPFLRLIPPHGAAVNTPEGVKSGSQDGGSYSLTWVLAPNPGDYGLASDAIPGSVALLRPTRLALEILPAPPHRQTERAIAKTPFLLRVRVKSPTGAQGDPGPVDLSFRTLGPRVAGSSNLTDYSWKSDLGAPPPGAGTVTAEGRTYDIKTDFQEDPEHPEQTYAGYLEVEARRGGAVVGALVAEHALRVDVHPWLLISPFPLSSYLAKDSSSRALRRHDRACSRFALTRNAGRLPHPDRPRYAVRAALTAADPAVVGRELNQAVFSLDGQPLELAGANSPQGGWSLGRTLDDQQLLGEHELCVQVGKPTAGDPGRPVELSVGFTLQEDPYDEYEVIQPHTVKLSIAPPTFFEENRAVIFAAATVLAVLGLLWYLRDRPNFPDDLRYALAREGPAPTLVARPLAAASATDRLLGLAAERPVMAADEDRLLGRVRAIDQDLFLLRPARGVTVEPVGVQETIEVRRGLATLAIHRTYRLRSSLGSYLFRMEYR